MTTPRRGQGFARRVTPDNLHDFRQFLQVRERKSSGGDQPADAPASSGSILDPASASLFSGRSIQVVVPYHRVPYPSQTPVPPSNPAPKGQLVWKKKLSRTDAQRQIGHPTGDLRLTQAHFQVAGKTIDHTQYFRYQVFERGDWRPESPQVEIASFDFDITAFGTHYGLFQLVVGHKPTGEAGQGNYTTGLRWGESMQRKLVETLDVTGATFSLYAPVSNAPAPFVIEITR